MAPSVIAAEEIRAQRSTKLSSIYLCSLFWL